MKFKFNSVLIFLIYIFINNVSVAAIVKGRLVGANDSAMIQSHIHFLPYSKYDTVIYSKECDKNGNFMYNINEIGFIEVQLTGVNHYILSFPIYIENSSDTIEIYAKLQQNKLLKNQKLIVTGNFNNYSIDSTKYMRAGKDGKYHISIEYPKDTLIYQLWNISGNFRTVNGTDADFFIYDGGGDYYSVKISKNKIKNISFDPSVFRNQASKPIVRIVNNKKLNNFVEKYFELMNTRKEFFENDKSHTEKPFIKKIASAIMNEFGKKMDKMLKDFENKINNENYYPTKMLYLFEYFNYISLIESINVISLFGIKLANVKINKSFIERYIKELHPTSPLWMKFTFKPSIAFVVSEVILGSKYEYYVDKFLDTFPVDSTKIGLMDDAIAYFEITGKNPERKNYYIGRLITEYPDDSHTQYLVKRYSKEENIKKGDKLPNFKINDFRNKNTISNNSLSGKYTIVDFWATWCGPCIRELHYLNEAYKKFKNHKNFQIISVSFDKDKNRVENFWSKYYSMPWINAIVQEGFSSEIAKNFNIISLPRIFLVDPQGNVIAHDSELKGDNLIKVLEKYLN